MGLKLGNDTVEEPLWRHSTWGGWRRMMVIVMRSSSSSSSSLDIDKGAKIIS